MRIDQTNLFAAVFGCLQHRQRTGAQASLPATPWLPRRQTTGIPDASLSRASQHASPVASRHRPRCHCQRSPETPDKFAATGDTNRLTPRKPRRCRQGCLRSSLLASFYQPREHNRSLRASRSCASVNRGKAVRETLGTVAARRGRKSGLNESRGTVRMCRRRPRR